MNRSAANHCLLTLFLAVTGTALAATPDPIGMGDRFPDFALSRSDGSTWQLGDYTGQPKLILFWATWCPYCRKLMPGIIELHNDFAKRGLEIVAVNFHDEKADTNAYAENMGINFDIVLNGDQLAERVGVRGTPTVFVLDADNRVRLRTSLSDPKDLTLRNSIELLIPPEMAGLAYARRGVFCLNSPHNSRVLTVHGRHTHCTDEGEDDPVVFLNGNPTSS